MRHYIREGAIKRKARIGRALAFGGLAILVVSFIYSFQSPDSVNLILVVALFATLISQVGISTLNRWGRHPRIDERLDEALKGFDDRYAIFHYLLGSPHVLIGPQGIMALIPRYEDGDISYEEAKWWSFQKRGSLLRRPGRREIKSIGSEAKDALDRLQKALNRTGLSGEELAISPVAVFVQPDTNVMVKRPSMDAVHIKKLKTWLRRKDKASSLAPLEIDKLAVQLGLAGREKET